MVNILVIDVDISLVGITSMFSIHIEIGRQLGCRATDTEPLANKDGVAVDIGINGEEII